MKRKRVSEREALRHCTEECALPVSGARRDASVFQSQLIRLR
jgi:hypothetical protein